jgi:hypothetical protein
MSLQHAAKHLEKHGRNGDTVLVHMSKGEVKSLNDIAMAHGGHLTINPHTGLPEAGFLSSLLPMVAGAGLMAISGGAINPLTAGLLVGGGTGLMTGDVKKGLVAGLGAYGGAGLASGLAASGTQAAAVNPSITPPVSAAPVTPPVESVMTQAPPPIRPFANVGDPNLTQMFDPATMGAPTPSGLSGPSISPESLGYKPLTPAPNMVTTPAANAAYESSLANQQMAFDTGTTGERLSTMGEGVKSLGRPGGFSNFYENLANDPNTYGAKTTLAAAAAPTIAYAMEPGKPPPDTPVDSDPGQQYDYLANPTMPTPSSSPYGAEQKYFNPQYVKRTEPRFAQGGISDAGYNLGGYSDGGRLLRGPGDGVSDSIPAVIGQKQPARLADGEFVVPARIVSELGNGSTEAGARKLYAMMDRIQKARGKTVGKGKVAKNSRSEKYLPA